MTTISRTCGFNLFQLKYVIRCWEKIIIYELAQLIIRIIIIVMIRFYKSFHYKTETIAENECPIQYHW